MYLVLECLSISSFARLVWLVVSLCVCWMCALFELRSRGPPCDHSGFLGFVSFNICDRVCARAARIGGYSACDGDDDTVDLTLLAFRCVEDGCVFSIIRFPMLPVSMAT